MGYIYTNNVYWWWFQWFPTGHSKQTLLPRWTFLFLEGSFNLTGCIGTPLPFTFILFVMLIVNNYVHKIIISYLIYLHTHNEKKNNNKIIIIALILSRYVYYKLVNDRSTNTFRFIFNEIFLNRQTC